MKVTWILARKMRFKIDFKVKWLAFIYSLEVRTYLVIKTITLTGSLAIVRANTTNGGPNAINKQPKNSIKAILRSFELKILVINQQYKLFQNKWLTSRFHSKWIYE